MKLQLTLLLAAALAMNAIADDKVLTVAVFDFQSPDEGMKEVGPQVSALISANLSTDARIIMVERAELEKIGGEQEMGKSGTISSDTAAKVGHLTGAQVLVTGRAFKVEKELFLVGKVMSVETGRVYGEVVKGPAARPWSALAEELARKIAHVVFAKSNTMVAKEVSVEERVEKLRASLKGDKRPIVAVEIKERHVNSAASDPAAQTELSLILQKCGFTLTDDKSTTKPQLVFTGEAFSELGMRKGNLVSCKARVELKLRDVESGTVIAVDRQTSVAVDLSEQIAGKLALERAALELAERMVPMAAK